MTEHGSLDRYRGRYPRFGEVAVLCEGDVAGFEVDLLEKWTTPEGFVDVWPCGTKTSLFGLSDAIGRSIRTFVVEDRDFRALREAQKACETKAKDRQRRAVRMVKWTCWNRNEIENYLIEPDVLVPALSESFGVPESRICERLANVIECLRVDQAVQATIAEFVERLPDPSDPKYIPGVDRNKARPRWNPQKERMEIPALSEVTAELTDTIQRCCKSLNADATSVRIDELILLFEENRAAWESVNFESIVWRTDWAGKEVLLCLAKWLAGEFGWSSNSASKREKLDWFSMKRKDVSTLERQLIEYLQPNLVKSFLGRLAGWPADGEIRKEWTNLRNDILKSQSVGNDE